MTRNPYALGLEVQRKAWENATEQVTRAAAAPETIETVTDVEVGGTENEVVYEENKLRLRHYRPDEDKRQNVPILVVYALINRPYILDLQPDRSVVRRLLEAGFDVYLIDWGEPSLLDSSLTLDDYVNRYIENCVDVVRERSGQDSINLLGYCMGGTMSAMYAALHPEKVRNLGLMATGLCFDDTGGVLERWGGEDFDPRDVTDAYGNVPSEFLDVGFAMMDPVVNGISKYVQFYENVDDEDFVENFARMERWINDGIDVAGETYVQFIEDVYQDNKLHRDELELDGKAVDLENLEMPILQIVGEYDHLMPPAASKPFNDVVPSDDVTTMEASVGHIGLSVSSTAHAELWPKVCEWFAERSEPETVGSEADEEAEVEADVEEDSVDEAANVEDLGVESTEAEVDDASTLESVDGIGSTYASRLRDAGVESVADLAAADVAEVAAETDLPVARLEDWVDRAKRIEQ